MTYSNPQIDEIVEGALREDLAWGDITTEALVPSSLIGEGIFLAKAEGVLAGISIVELTFNKVDPNISLKPLFLDGRNFNKGDKLAVISGPLAGILKAERTALNILQRMSAIATETSKYVAAIGNLKTRILDTRKTMPGLRILDKYAVRLGGGQNHRFHLGDGILIKDNHIACLKKAGCSLSEGIKMVRARAPFHLKVEVEVTNHKEVREALEAGADMLLLDNMTPEQMKVAVKIVKGRCLTEASGGVNLNTVKAIAETGVDFISVGAITHSIKALDISLEVGLAE